MRNKALAALLLAVILTLLLSSLALAQTPAPQATATPRLTPTPYQSAGPLDTRALAETMAQSDFKIVLLVTLIFGALGGLVYELLVLQGSVETPHRVAEGGWVLDLGVLGRMLMGSMAAVAGLYVAPPETAYKLVAVAVVAGVSASAIFKSVQSRVETIVAQQVAAQAQESIGQIVEKAEMMAQAMGVDEAAADSTRGMIRPPSTPTIESARRASQLLGEIRTISSSARRVKRYERKA